MTVLSLVVQRLVQRRCARRKLTDKDKATGRVTVLSPKKGSNTHGSMAKFAKLCSLCYQQCFQRYWSWHPRNNACLSADRQIRAKQTMEAWCLRPLQRSAKTSSAL